MSLEEDYIYGYKKYEKHFNKLCKNSSAILGNITQCGIAEICKSGRIFIAANRPEFGEVLVENKAYKLDPTIAYSSDIPDGFLEYSGHDDFEYLWGDQKSFLGKIFDIRHGFQYSEKIDDETYRQYFFASDGREIYNILVRNLSLIKNFIMHFKEANRDIFNEMQDRKFDISKEKDTYFIKPACSDKTDKERLLNFLHLYNLLNKNETLTDREFQCMKYYCRGRTSKAIGEIFNISNRTAETHINSLKEKLQVHSREELRKKIEIN